MSPRLPALRPREVVRALERDGWVAQRQRGSHLHMVKEGRDHVVSVPMHRGDIPRGTLASILRDADLTDERFLELLRS